VSVATPGRVDGNPLVALGESAVEPLPGEAAVEAEPRIESLALLVLARFFDALFALMGAVSCGRDALGPLRLTALSSAIAVMTFSPGFVTATFAEDGGVDPAPKVDGAVRDVLLGVDVTWSSTSAAPITPTTIVPKAMEK
jgi:hypothetical protein